MDTPLPPISLGILSWRGHHSLSRTLPSYAKENLFSLATETILFLPEPEDRTIASGEAHGLKVLTAPKNLGILGGFRWMAETLENDLLLLLEDDVPLVANQDESQRQLAISAHALLSGDVEVVRLRHRRFPGMGPRYKIVEKLHRYFPPPGAPAAQRHLAALRRGLRPGKAARLAGNILYENADPFADPYDLSGADPRPAPLRPEAPDAMFPHWITHRPEGYYRVSAATMNWSNQSIMVRKDFFLEKIIAYAAAHPSPRRVNGFPDIEKELNCAYWRRSGWHVGMPPGLFSHELPDHDALAPTPAKLS